MTIAVAAKFPWGALNNLIPANVVIPESVILASDSRYSRQTATGYVPSSDSGTKLFQIGRDVAGVYAGVSRIGEICFDTLRRNLGRQSSPTSDTSKRIAQQTFNKVYRHEIAVMRLNPDQAPLYILIGACNNAGNAELFRFSYQNNFVPVTVEGLDVLGWEQTSLKFIELLTGELHKKVEEELALRRKYTQIPMAQMSPMPIADGQVAILVVAMLRSLIEEGSNTTIGGNIQLAQITKDGLIFPSVSFTTNPTNDGPGWTRATANGATLHTVTGISGGLGIYHSSE